MSETRQQRRARERAEQLLRQKIEAFRRTSPLAEETYHAGHTDGWRAGCNFAMKTCYAAAVTAFQELEGYFIDGYSAGRNARFLRIMDELITNTLTSEEIMDEAFEKAGVQINFREVFSEDRVQEAK